MNVEISVYIRTTFEGFHRWKEAPQELLYLRDYHRHIFHVEVIYKVKHGDRDKEFITLKNRMDDYLMKWKNKYFDESCEQIAMDIAMSRDDIEGVRVSEDGENGAYIWVNR
jgi:hypothetical protein